jgi:hypothetical protein
MSKTALKKIAVLTGLVCAPAAPNLWAQVREAGADSLSRAAADSALLEDSESAAYEIARLRVQRRLIRNGAQPETEAVKNLAELLREAESFAQEADYVTAQVLLETALDLISASNPTKPASPAETSIPPVFSSSTKATWRWHREALAGLDLSRLEYELGSEDPDEFFAELQQRSVQDHANPFAGVRVNLARTGAAPWDLRAFSLLKTSRDYHSGALEMTAQSASTQQTSWRADNRFEATAYRDTSGLRYWQNTALLQGGVKLGKRVRVEVGEEFRVRQYRSEGRFSPNYRHNEIGLSATYAGGFSTRLQTRYEYGVRTHPGSQRDDYLEHRFEASIAQHSYESASIYVQNIWRRRIYPLGVADSTFQNTYREEYLRADLTFTLAERLGLRLEGDLTLRQYETPSVFTPDFFNAKLNPKLQFKIWRDWQASAGYIFLVQVNGTQAQASSSTALASGFYEDYYANGFTLGLDLFSTSGLLLSASHVFEARIYPDSQLDRAAAFNPNPNRNNNSFLVFLSWQINPRWQVNAIGNFDSQISRAEYREDLRNTIFSVELGCAF